ncbi:MAG: hypothetical protein RBS43_10845, partial [Candidatus Cloacimonas sp.]|nr:hypothetical protein [Candidatus Cloacimonas sp.]
MNEAMQILSKLGGKPYVSKVVQGENEYTITYKLKDAIDRGEAVKSYGAALNMTADVTEYNGVLEPYKILSQIYNKAFDIKIEPGKNNTAKGFDRDSLITRNGLFKEIANVKQAMYGRNYEMNRNWTETEMMDLLKSGDPAFGSSPTTLIGLARGYISNTKLSLATVTNDNYKAFQKMYEDYADNTPGPASMMRRGSFKVKYNDDIKVMFDNKLWDVNERNNIINNPMAPEAWTLGTAARVLRGKLNSSMRLNLDEMLPFDLLAIKESGKSIEWSKEYHAIKKQYEKDMAQYEGLKKDPVFRALFVNEQYRISEGYLLNDMWTMISGKLLEKHRMDLPSILRSQIPRRITDQVRQLENKVEAERNGEPIAGELADKTLDEAYVMMKAKLSEEEQKLFDIAIMGSMRLGGKGVDGEKLGSYKTNNDTIAFKLASAPSDAFKEYNKAFGDLLNAKAGINDVGLKEITDIDLSDMDALFQAVVDNPSLLKKANTYIDFTAIDVTNAERMIVKGEIDKAIPLTLTKVGKAALAKSPELMLQYNTRYLPEAQKFKAHLDRLNLTDPVAINNLIRGVTSSGGENMGKDLSSLTFVDLQMVNRALDYTTNPSILNRLFGGKTASNPILQRIYYMMIPSETGRNIQQFAYMTKQVPAMWKNKYGAMFADTVTVPTNAIEAVSDTIHNAESFTIRKREQYKKRLKEQMARFMSNEHFDDLYRVFTVLRDSDETIAELQLSDLPASDKQEKIQKLREMKTKANHDLTVITSMVGRIPVKYTDASGIDRVDQLTPRQIVDQMGDITTKYVADIYNDVIKANMEEVYKYAKRDKFGNIKMLFNPKTGKPTIPEIDKAKWNTAMEEALAKGGEWPTNFGIDGLKIMSHSILYQQSFNTITSANMDEAARFLEMGNLENITTGRRNFSTYFPRIHKNREAYSKDINKLIHAVENDKSMSPDTKEKWIKKYLRDFLQSGGNLQNEMDIDTLHRMYGLTEEVKESMTKSREISNERLTYMNGMSTAGNQRHREFYSLGYERNIEALDLYTDSIVGTYYRNFAQTISRIKIAEFSSIMHKKFGKDVGDRWNRFMHLYAQGAAGYGVTIPEYMKKDPGMKLTNTLYSAYADNHVVNALNSVAKKLGIAKNKTNMFGEAFSQKDIANWSALEAKYSLATLLARPKGMVANAFGGSLNTGISTGFGPLLRAQSTKELQK